ncbi:MAG TPA: hypothetical protein VIN07_05930 [Flavipsychrobacter sp.]
MMKPKTYGLKTLASFFLGCLWMYIIVGDEMKIFLPSVLTIAVLSILFVPLVYIDEQLIRLRSLRPFADKLELRFEDIERIHLYAGNIRFRMEFYMKDGTRKSTTNFFRYYDMEEVFEHLDASGVQVTSSGIRAITWRK